MYVGEGSAPEQYPPAPAAAEPRQKRIRRRIWAVCFALFAFEIGAFLLLFPWMDSWSLNHLPGFIPKYAGELQDIWDDPYFKGAISGLGVLNVYIAFRQVVSLLRRRQ